ncbi:glia maturation factor gamma isoform X1 [Trichosurus vulpecula]|uniref:glia maturation factor gamma isoform X1 n=2 Tax=Trichosurus vulpecula TaxID=9337 RepID=UPI00186AFC53|nr:glia maturation factor gamma isoform X1 [Trichosurus vulpecula]
MIGRPRQGKAEDWGKKKEGGRTALSGALPCQRAGLSWASGLRPAGGGFRLTLRCRDRGGKKAELRCMLQEIDRKADSLVVCEVDPELKEKLRKFRFRKDTTNSAIIMKVDKDRQLVVMEEEFQNISPEELRNELPERQPRFIVYSYKWLHEDGRISYPLCFIFSSPVGCKPEQQMMYAGSKNRLVQTAELTKVFEIRTTDDLTEAWLQEKLAFFR